MLHISGSSLATDGNRVLRVYGAGSDQEARLITPTLRVCHGSASSVGLSIPIEGEHSSPVNRDLVPLLQGFQQQVCVHMRGLDSTEFIKPVAQLLYAPSKGSPLLFAKFAAHTNYRVNDDPSTPFTVAPGDRAQVVLSFRVWYNPRIWGAEWTVEQINVERSPKRKR